MPGAVCNVMLAVRIPAASFLSRCAPVDWTILELHPEGWAHFHTGMSELFTSRLASTLILANEAAWPGFARHTCCMAALPHLAEEITSKPCIMHILTSCIPSLHSMASPQDSVVVLSHGSNHSVTCECSAMSSCQISFFSRVTALKPCLSQDSQVLSKFLCAAKLDHAFPAQISSA